MTEPKGETLIYRRDDGTPAVEVQLVDETRVFVATAFRDGHLQTGGTAITKVLPPVSRFSAHGQHGATKQRVIQKLTAFFERFSGLGASGPRDLS